LLWTFKSRHGNFSISFIRFLLLYCYCLTQMREQTREWDRPIE
jgi:hypothetical protein